MWSESSLKLQDGEGTVFPSKTQPSSTVTQARNLLTYDIPRSTRSEEAQESKYGTEEKKMNTSNDRLQAARG